MLNTLSGIAYKVMSLGLTADNYKPIYVPDENFRDIVKIMFDVPEKPEGYQPAVEINRASRKTTVLVTGGLDSTVCYVMALQKTGQPPMALYIDMGQPYAEKEQKVLRDLNIEFKVIKKKPPHDIAKSWKHIQPGRNLFYLAAAAEFMVLGGELWIGATDGEMPIRSGDKSVEFFSLAQTLFDQYLPHQVKIQLPVKEMTKSDEIGWLLRNGWLDSQVRRTYSCFTGEEKHCGHCQSCVRRFLAFWNNGIDSAEDYYVHPMIGGEEYINKYKDLMGRAVKYKDFSRYSERRSIQDLDAIKNYETSNRK